MDLITSRQGERVREKEHIFVMSCFHWDNYSECHTMWYSSGFIWGSNPSNLPWFPAAQLCCVFRVWVFTFRLCEKLGTCICAFVCVIIWKYLTLVQVCGLDCWYLQNIILISRAFAHFKWFECVWNSVLTALAGSSLLYSEEKMKPLSLIMV